MVIPYNVIMFQKSTSYAFVDFTNIIFSKADTAVLLIVKNTFID